ncbi:MAG: hypothetical protein JW828_11910 [Sedimentisphaerales bacterium]|nr:hypothetical protein [Sedimentisphaerales bacterium]
MAQLAPENRRHPFAGWPMAVFWAMMLVFTFYACTHMVAAGDTWVALACGRHFVNHGVDTVEPFSFNSHKAGPIEEDIAHWPGWAQSITKLVGLKTVQKWHPTGWINQNWLTHVIFYDMVHWFGSGDNPHYNALIYWKFGIYLLNVIAVYYLARWLGVSVPGSAAAASIALFVGRTFLDIRPAGFSNLLAPVFLLVLVLSVYRNIRYIWLIVPITVFWANVHGGYLYVFVMLVPFFLLHLLSLALPPNRFVRLSRPKDLLHIAGAGATAFVAMVVLNPFHFTNLTHTFEISVSKHAESWRTVNEWHSAFEWSNPVGESFPFLVFFILGTSATIVWLVCRLFRPLPADRPMRQLKAQDGLFQILSPACGTLIAMGTCLALYIAFSVIGVGAANITIAAVFIGILVLSVFWSIHFVYFAGLFTILVLSLTPAFTPAQENTFYYGRYIYPFVLLPTFVLLHLFASFFPRRSGYKPLHLAFAGGTAVLALIIMLAWINPFARQINPASPDKVTFLQAVGHLPHLERIWFPTFEYQGQTIKPFDYPHYFPVLYMVNLAAIVLYLLYPNWKHLFSSSGSTKPASVAVSPKETEFSWPRIDLAILSIAAMTVYMAVQSRRFIPIAASASAPVLALFIEQSIHMVRARWSYNKDRRLTLPAMSPLARTILLCIGVSITAVCGIGWGVKYKRIYLDPWPADAVRDSVFMRMTASNIKPFDVCTFIRDNRIEGRMFNYWTEGGALAWGQTPDPQTGKTPLQLFMDGRAQAAYNHDTFETWRFIKGGGQPIQEAMIKTGKLTMEDFRKSGEWIDEQLRQRDVWVVLMPSTEVPYPGMSLDAIIAKPNFYFVYALQTTGTWATAYMDDQQYLFVSIKTPRGEKLIADLLADKLLFPNEYARNLTLANAYLRYNDPALSTKGFEYAKEAFALYPSQTSALMLHYRAWQFGHLRTSIIKVFQPYVDDFMDNQSRYFRQGGYADRLVAALFGSQRLASHLMASDPERARHYMEFEKIYHSVPIDLAVKAKW